MIPSDYVIKLNNGEYLRPNYKELVRLARTNATAARQMNPAKNAWGYWSKINQKSGLKKESK